MSAADKVFGISVSFLVGVSLGNLGVSFLTVLFISAAAACVLTIITKEKLWAAVFFVFVFAGLVYYHLYLNIRAATENLPIGKQVSFSGVVVSEPARYEKAQSFLVKLQEPFRGAVEVVTNSSQQMRYGDLLAIEGNVAPGENAAAPSQSLFPKIHKEDADRGSWIKGRLLSIKERFTAAFAEALPYDEGALLQGITLGSRAGFSKDLKESMKNSGTTHIVAMSGYNITILAVAIGCLLSYFLPRRVAFFFTVIAIALFVTMVGGEASVVRAAFMGILLLLCQTVGRPHDSRNAIALAASVMVLANPTIIINDLGFILSFMSLLGIVYLSPALKYVLGMDAAAQSLSFLSWKENLVMTLSAQLAVLPIIVVSFGQFSLTAIIANMLVLPFIPITMAIGFALGAVSLLWAPLGFVFAKASQILLTYETSVMYLFGKLQVPIRGIFASRTAFIAYYIALVYIVWHSRKPPTQTCAPQKEQ